MSVRGAVFTPEEIVLLKGVLDKAVASLSVAERTCARPRLLAQKILTCAAKAERDAVRLRTTALIGYFGGKYEVK